MDLSFWLAVIALLLAVWAVVRGEQLGRRVNLNAAACKQGFEGSLSCIESIESRLSALEERVKHVETHAFGQHQWPPTVLRTTSGPKPEVRNVTEGELRACWTHSST